MSKTNHAHVNFLFFLAGYGIHWIKWCENEIYVPAER